MKNIKVLSGPKHLANIPWKFRCLISATTTFRSSKIILQSLKILLTESYFPLVPIKNDRHLVAQRTVTCSPGLRIFWYVTKFVKRFNTFRGSMLLFHLWPLGEEYNTREVHVIHGRYWPIVPAILTKWKVGRQVLYMEYNSAFLKDQSTWSTK